VEGKAIVSRNPFKGGKRLALRRSIAQLRLCIKANDDFLDEFRSR
jgi:hypothetical protein